MMNTSDTGKNASFISALKKDWYILFLILATLLFGLYLYPALPDKVPSHWNIHGEVDGWSGKSFAVWFFPLLNLGMYVLFLALPRIDPQRANYHRFSRTYRVFRIFFHLFLALLYLVTLLAALGYPLEIDFLVKIGISLLFLVLGNFMGKIKHNYFVGIKTPWTLADEENWRLTHRFAGPIWVGVGLFGVLLSFFRTVWAGYLFFAALMAAALIPFFYSYLVFRKSAPKN